MRDEILLKSRLLCEGVRVDPGAVQGLGTRYKEQLHHLFEYDADLHGGNEMPADLRLPKGSVVQVRLNERSPFLIRNDAGLYIEGNGALVSTMEWVERPALYSGQASSGTPFATLGEMVGEDCISVCHTNACITFSNGKQCAFCNLNFTSKEYDDVIVRKRAGDVGELIAAALRGHARHFLITGGILPGNREMDVLVEYLGAIRSASGLRKLPGVAIMTPPPDLGDIERLAGLGMQGIGFNLECFHPAFFAAMCPGKEELVGYAKYRQALRVAVDAFGAGGRVFSGFVAGLEPMEHLLAGVQELAEEGVAAIPLVWSPSAGTRLHGHRPPHAEWYVELTERAASILVRHMKRAIGPSPTPLRCARCQNQSLLHDVIQSRTQLFNTSSHA